MIVATTYLTGYQILQLNDKGNIIHELYSSEYNIKDELLPFTLKSLAEQKAREIASNLGEEFTVVDVEPSQWLTEMF